MNKPLFTPETREVAGHRRRVQVVRCGDCPAEEVFTVTTRSNGGMADETIMRKAKLKGWSFGRQGRNARCPGCGRLSQGLVMVRKLATDPEAVAEAAGVSVEDLSASADTMRVEAVLASGAPSLKDLEARIAETGLGEVYDAIPLRKPGPEEEPPMSDTTAPRELTREWKRRINARLDEVYAGEDTGYSADWTDEKVARDLGVPRAWVEAIRVELHGENAGNEASSEEARARKRALHELRRDVSAIETRFLTALADCEKALGPIKARLAKLDPEGEA